MLAQMVGAGLIHPQRIHHELGHAHLDLVEKARLWWIKRVVKVKDPGGHMGEMLFCHGATLSRSLGACNSCALPDGAGQR